MKLLITGGAGFIGSNFIFFMEKTHPECRLVCLDKLTYAGNLATLAPVREKPNFKFIRADIADREAIYGIFETEKPDVVVNFAAESHVDRSIEDPGIFLQTNVMGTQVLLDACRKYGVQRFHQVSTDEGQCKIKCVSYERSNEHTLFYTAWMGGGMRAERECRLTFRKH